MKRKTLFLLPLLGLFYLAGVAPAMASGNFQVTETVTPTETPAATVTPTPTQSLFDVDCPPEGVLDAGTLTPSPLWMLQCSHCLTPIGWEASPIPTATLDSGQMTSTAVAEMTTTPTPESTSTPDVNLTPTGMPENYELSEYSIAPNNVWYPYVYVTDNDLVCVREGSENRIIHCWGTVTWLSSKPDIFPVSGAGAVVRFSSSLNIVSNENCGKPIYVAGSFSGDGLASFNATDRVGCSSPMLDVDNITSPFEIAGTVNRNNAYSAARFTFDVDGVGIPQMKTVTVDFRVSLDYIGLPVPTPTPSPTLVPYDGSYCEVIGSGSGDDLGFGFDLFVPDGDMNCGGGWDAITVLDYTLPSAEICFQPSNFGVVRLFGREWEAGSLGLVLGAAFLWRFLGKI